MRTGCGPLECLSAPPPRGTPTGILPPIGGCVRVVEVVDVLNPKPIGDAWIEQDRLINLTAREKQIPFPIADVVLDPVDNSPTQRRRVLAWRLQQANQVLESGEVPLVGRAAQEK